jgi:signal peptidase I
VTSDGGGRAERPPRPSRGALVRFLAGVAASGVVVGVSTLMTFALLPAFIPGWTSTSVTSGSMTPAFRVGDVVVTQRISDTTNITPPAVVLVERPGMLPLLHRISALSPKGGYVTKGDANPTQDSDVIERSSIIGVGRLVIPWVGWPAIWAQQRNYPALALLSVVLLLVTQLARYGWLDRHDPWANAARRHAANLAHASDGEPEPPEQTLTAAVTATTADVIRLTTMAQQLPETDPDAAEVGLDAPAAPTSADSPSAPAATS